MVITKDNKIYKEITTFLSVLTVENAPEPLYAILRGRQSIRLISEAHLDFYLIRGVPICIYVGEVK